jgi:hypothetical protein
MAACARPSAFGRQGGSLAEFTNLVKGSQFLWDFGGAQSQWQPAVQQKYRLIAKLWSLHGSASRHWTKAAKEWGTVNH